MIFDIIIIFLIISRVVLISYFIGVIWYLCAEEKIIEHFMLNLSERFERFIDIKELWGYEFHTRNHFFGIFFKVIIIFCMLVKEQIIFTYLFVKFMIYFIGF